MTTNRSSPATDALCPFCKKPPGTKVGPPAMARCLTPGCEGTRLAAVTLAEWNAPAPAMTPPVTSQEALLMLADRIKLALSDNRALTGVACKHGFDLAVCVAKECENPYALEPLLEQAEKALRGVAQSPITRWNGADKLERAELARRLQWVAVQVAGLPDKLPRASMEVLQQAVDMLGSPVSSTQQREGGK